MILSSKRVLLALSCAVFLLVPPQTLRAANDDIEAYKQSLLAAVEKSFSSSSTAPQETAPALDSSSNRDLVTLTRPTIVRIITHIMGTTSIPKFSVNLKTRKWSVDMSTTTPVPYDTYGAGSGFIVSPDGYILTNAHVVSDASLRVSAATSLASTAIFTALLTMSYPEYEALKKSGYTAETTRQLQIDGITFIKNKISLPSKSTITVLRPADAKEATTTSAFITQLSQSSLTNVKAQVMHSIASGTPATVVYVNDSFYDDERDVALIKVQEKNLPAMRLGSSEAVSTGSSIYVFGFPSNADFNELSTEPTFTSGSVSALKPSTQHTFNYIMLDAKISSGSSGGPVFNERGEALGLLTLGGQQTSGDTFGMALPIDIAKQFISPAYFLDQSGNDFASHFIAGLQLKRDYHCKAAIQEFELAALSNNVFGGTATYLQPYIDECETLIASGKSVDSIIDQTLHWLSTRQTSFWVGAGIVVVVFSILSGALLIITKRMHREEVLIENLEHEMANQPKGAISPPASTTVPATAPAAVSPAHPELVQFITAARAAGQTDDKIRASLLTSGWSAEDVSRELDKKLG